MTTSAWQLGIPDSNLIQTTENMLGDVQKLCHQTIPSPPHLITSLSSKALQTNTSAMLNQTLGFAMDLPQNSLPWFLFKFFVSLTLFVTKYYKFKLQKPFSI